LLGFALAALSGIAAAEWLSGAGVVGIALALCAGAILAIRRELPAARLRAGAVLLLGLLAGAALHAGAAAQREAPCPALARLPDGALVRVRVRVLEGVSPLHPAGSLGRSDGLALGRVPSASLRVAIDSVALGEGPRPVPSAPARLVVGRGIPSALPGDRLEAIVRLVRPRPPGNPGAPSPQELQRMGGVRWLLLAPCAEALRPVLVTEGAAGFAPFLAVRGGAERARRAIESRLGASLAPRDAGLLAGLLLGDRSAVTEGDRRAFERSGTMHILAVSGLHVVIVLAAWGALLARSGAPRRTRIAALCLVAVCYVAIAGFRTPVTRAALMAATALLATAAGRRLDGWSALAAAALALLCVDPLACFRPGWQLSFTAVAALLFAAGPLQRLLAGSAPEGTARWRDIVGGLFAASAAATLGTFPLVWFHFGTAAPAALVANLLAVPLLALLLVGGLCLLPLLMAGGGAAQAAAAVLGAGCALLRVVVEGFGALPGGWLLLPPIGAAAAAALLAGLWWIARGGWRARPRVTFGLVAVLAVWLVWSGGPPPRRHWVFDVGQGSALLLRTPAGHRILVDAGSSSLAFGGARELRRALAAAGVGYIDLLVLSHGDADHINAVEPLVRDFGVARVWAAPELEQRGGGRRLLARLRALGVPVEIVRDGTVAQGLGPGTELRVLHPGAGDRLQGNEGSLVVRYAEPGGVILIPGDIEEAGTADLLARRAAEVGCDLLIAPHHGGGNDRLPELLDVAAPKAVVVSAGRRFPIGASLAELARRELPVWVTAVHGAVAVTLEPDFSLKAERLPGR
jgi:competence protein ComEC